MPAGAAPSQTELQIETVAEEWIEKTAEEWIVIPILLPTAIRALLLTATRIHLRIEVQIGTRGLTGTRRTALPHEPRPLIPVIPVLIPNRQLPDSQGLPVSRREPIQELISRCHRRR